MSEYVESGMRQAYEDGVEFGTRTALEPHREVFAAVREWQLAIHDIWQEPMTHARAERYDRAIAVLADLKLPGDE